MNNAYHVSKGEGVLKLWVTHFHICEILVFTANVTSFFFFNPKGGERWESFTEEQYDSF